MAKEEISKEVKEIKKALESKKVVIGSKLTIKNIKLGKANKVFLSSNCSQDVKEEIESLSKKSKLNIITLDYPNDELGVICRKPFSISVLSINK